MPSFVHRGDVHVTDPAGATLASPCGIPAPTAALAVLTTDLPTCPACALAVVRCGRCRTVPTLVIGLPVVITIAAEATATIATDVAEVGDFDTEDWTCDCEGATPPTLDERGWAMLTTFAERIARDAAPSLDVTLDLTPEAV